MPKPEVDFPPLLGPPATCSQLAPLLSQPQPCIAMVTVLTPWHPQVPFLERTSVLYLSISSLVTASLLSSGTLRSQLWPRCL